MNISTNFINILIYDDNSVYCVLIKLLAHIKLLNCSNKLVYFNIFKKERKEKKKHDD